MSNEQLLNREVQEISSYNASCAILEVRNTLLCYVEPLVDKAYLIKMKIKDGDLIDAKRETMELRDIIENVVACVNFEVLDLMQDEKSNYERMESDQRTKGSSLSVTASVFVPQQSPSHSQVNGGGITFILEAVIELQSCPEDFFQAACRLNQELEKYIVDEKTFDTAIDQLFYQCVHQSNFQYIGARLCSHLAAHLTIDYKGNFRTRLLRRSQREYSQRNDLVKSPDGLRNLMDYTMFMAELMLNLTLNGEPYEIFPPIVADLLTTLLSTSNDDTIKCISRILKLCGAKLDSNKKSQITMDALFAQIKIVIVDNVDSVHRNQRLQLLNLVELRAKKWIIEETTTSSSSQQNPYASAVLEPECDAYGQQIYYEEDQFGDPNYGYNTDPYAGEVNYHGDVVFEASTYHGDQGYPSDPIYEEYQENSYEGGDPGVEGWQGNVEEDLTVVYDGDTPYVIDTTSQPNEMDPEMIEAFEAFMTEKERQS